MYNVICLFFKFTLVYYLLKLHKKYIYIFIKAISINIFLFHKINILYVEYIILYSNEKKYEYKHLSYLNKFLKLLI